MSEQIAHRTGSAIDLRPAMPWLAAAAVCLLLAAVGPKLLNDPDTYSHISSAGSSRTGRCRRPIRSR
jgi:hypothetical protein